MPRPGGRGSAIMQGQTLQVRRNELPAPVKDGTFAIGAETLTVLDDPRSDDPDRHPTAHVWSNAPVLANSSCRC